MTAGSEAGPAGPVVSAAPEQLAALMASADPAVAAAGLRELIAVEDSLVADNRLAPYADRVPPLLVAAPPQAVARTLGVLSGPEMRRALFGSFRQVPAAPLRQIIRHLDDPALARLLAALASGQDGPRQAARLVADADQPPLAALRLLEADRAARLLGLLLGAVAAALLQAAESDVEAEQWWRGVEEAALPAERVVLASARLLRGSPASARVTPDPRDVAATLSTDTLVGEQDALETLRRGDLGWQRDVLGACSAEVAGRLLVSLASESPDEAGVLLGALVEFVLVEGSARRVPHAPRAVPVLDVVPEPARSVLVAALDRRVAEALLPVVVQRQHVPPAYPRVGPRGALRRRRQVAPGVDWIHLQETVQVDDRRLPLRVDLLELDPTRVQIVVRRAPGEQIPLPEVQQRVGQAGRTSARPQEALFRSLGLVRLSEQVRREGAVAGLNGGFYFDYGHYLDALDLGIDLSQETSLAYGDVIDWFVEDGVEHSAPLFGRAALAVTDAGTAHLRRVRVTSVEVAGLPLAWDSVNRRGTGRIRYDRTFGPRTPEDPDRLDVVIAAGSVVDVVPSGGAHIPLLGFVLSLPRGVRLDPRVRPGARVVVRHDFPPRLGRVQQAMACGPLLVRDGQVDVDVAAESFGDKDSSVLPLSLTRAADSFRAARSFLMLRAGRLCFGAVSGTMLGGGPPAVSVGVTFGELSQLCVDLGADDAMALDGGGSSTLVAAAPMPRVLNVPTGGSDVPVGSERFLKTYLLATARSA